MHARRRDGYLPTVAADFIGRGPELDRISALLGGSARLITLSGPGGIGKTRLAAEAIRRYSATLSSQTPTFWVRLARLARDSDIEAVEEEIAQSVIEVDFSDRSAWDALVDTLGSAETAEHGPDAVLVLDNCEHVLAGVAAMIEALLRAVPGLTIVATSREHIGRVDEHLVPVPPLSDLQALSLFRQRAEFIGKPISGSDRDAAAQKICRHVHNHPLFIHLVAGRLTRQPLPLILQGLTGETDDKRMHWSQGPRVGDDAARHGGITDVVAWSYDLCTEKERLLFDRMSVFAAGYDINPEDKRSTSVDVGADLDAVETICCDSDEGSGVSGDGRGAVVLARHEIEEILDRLVDQSLVTVHVTATTVRYSLLESLRLFARRRLDERSKGVESARLLKRHRQYYRDKIVYGAAHWFSPAEQELVDWARAAWDNVLTAIDTSIQTPSEAATGLEICVGLVKLRVPFQRGSIREARRSIQRCLDASRTLTPQPTELQITAMAAVAWLAVRQGDREVAARILEDCVAACITDPTARSNWRADPEADNDLPADVELAWGTELFMAHRDKGAIPVLVRAREKFARVNDHGGEMMAGMFAGMAAGRLGTAQQAHDISKQCLDGAIASGAMWATSWAEMPWGMALIKLGRPAEAADVLRHALAHQLSIRDQWGSAWVVQILTWALATILADMLKAENPDQAAVVALARLVAHLTGGARTQQRELGIRIARMGTFADASADAVDVARSVLGPDAYAAAEARGSRLRPEASEVQRLAVGEITLEPPAGAEAIWSTLTPTEHETAVRAAAGWTNGDIADHREASVKTINAHMTSTLRKLGITSREEIIFCVPPHVIEQVEEERRLRPMRNNRRAQHRPPRQD